MAVSDETIVSVRGLQKRYAHTEALKGIDLDVRKGELLGLIGPDGAGKTTIFQILAGVMRDTGGEVMVLGTTPRNARFDVGYLPQRLSIYPELSVAENMQYAAEIRDLPASVYALRQDQYLGKMGLSAFKDRLARHLSGGMKEKLALCCALVGQPRLLLLDEPTEGLDPVSRREMWSELAQATENGITVVVSTPHLDEAEACDRVALIHDGKINRSGAPRALLTELALQRLKVHTSDQQRAEQIIRNAAAKPGTKMADVQAFGDRIDVLSGDAEAAQGEIEGLLSSNGVKVSHIDVGVPTLENVLEIQMRREGAAQKQQSERAFPGVAEQRSMQANASAISARGVWKTFSGFTAVKGLDLDVHYGEILGLLGANGAGKTTAMQMLCGLQAPTRGEVILAQGAYPFRSKELRRKIGYMNQKFTLYEELTVRENLEFYSASYGLSSQKRRERMDWAIDACGLAQMQRSSTGSLPRGSKQKIAFAASILHHPEILFLDEPTSGMDPLARKQIWRIIRELALSGTAVLVTTHFLDEAEYCGRIGLMVQGVMVAQGSPEELKKDRRVIEVSTSDLAPALKALQSLDSWRVSRLQEAIHITTDEQEKDLGRIKSLLGNAQVSYTGIRLVPASLEETFVEIVQSSAGAQS